VPAKKKTPAKSAGLKGGSGSDLKGGGDGGSDFKGGGGDGKKNKSGTSKSSSSKTKRK
jgi:hypothetical protein